MRIVFYASKIKTVLNRKPWIVEKVCDNICLNPHYPVRLRRRDINILMDSGAFQDVDTHTRLLLPEALKRQLLYEKYLGAISHRIVSYDQLVDEQVIKGKKTKCRVDEAIGWDYVATTIEAAKYLASKRSSLKPRQLVLSCQGTTVEQYLDCIKEVLDVSEPGDCIGLGGFCIIGTRPKLQVQFFEIVKRGFPLIKKYGIEDVHLFGVTSIPILKRWSEINTSFGLNLSTDSSSLERAGIFGRVFLPETGSWDRKRYKKEDKYKNYHPRDLSLLNVLNFLEYLDSL